MSRKGRWRVAIVEDHLLQRARAAELIDAQPGIRVVHVDETLDGFARWLRGVTQYERPHLLILDLMVDRGPDADPAMVSSFVRAGGRVMILSALTSVAHVRAMIRAGATAVVGKRDPEEDILAAVESTLNGTTWMTPDLAGIIAGDEARPSLSAQEEQTLVLYASGLSMRAVATAMGVKTDTAKKYLQRVKEKYARVGRPAHTKLELGRNASDDGYLA